MKDVDICNIRLRIYDPKLDAKQAVHDQWDVQLHKLNFFNFMDLLIETKKEGEEFEKYDPDTLYL